MQSLTIEEEIKIKHNTVIPIRNQQEGVDYSFEDTGTFKNPL